MRPKNETRNHSMSFSRSILVGAILLSLMASVYSGPVLTLDCPNIPHCVTCPGIKTCTCEEGYIWVYPTCNLPIDCSTIPGSAGPSVDGVTCPCSYPDLMFWNATANICYWNCSKFAHSISTNVNVSETCCLPEYDLQFSEYYTFSNCSARCYLDLYAVPGSSPDINGHCTCIAGSVFDVESARCSVDCSTIVHATSNLNPSTCNCEAGYFWAFFYEECKIILDCENMNNADPQPPINDVMCICELGWFGTTYIYWNDSACVRNCSNFPHSYDVITDETLCPCQPGYTVGSNPASTIGDICNAGCSTDPFAVPGSSPDANGNCVSKCVINCAAINSTDLTPSITGFSCQCKDFPRFDFNQTALQCRINCPWIANTNGAVSSDGVNCVCKNNVSLAWNGTHCLWVCSKFNNNNGINAFICSCGSGYMPGYDWGVNTANAYGMNCNAKCYADLYASSPTPLATGRCSCKNTPTFAFYDLWGVCALNCSRITNAVALTNVTVCSCANHYAWNATSLTCDMNCSSYSNTNATASLTTFKAGNCVCNTPFKWNATTKICSLDCTKVINSTGAAAVNGACACKSGYSWNSVTLLCVRIN